MALVASKWARQCVIGHDSGSRRQVPCEYFTERLQDSLYLHLQAELNQVLIKKIDLTNHSHSLYTLSHQRVSTGMTDVRDLISFFLFFFGGGLLLFLTG